jgi:hypothetical protein
MPPPPPGHGLRHRLELRVKKASFLENVSKVLSDLFPGAYFEFSSTGLELQAVDTSGGAYVVLQLRSEAFDHYSCDHDHFMGLGLDAMVKAFSFADNNDIISIKFQINGFCFPISLVSPGNKGVFAHLHLASPARQPASGRPKPGETRPPLLVWHTGSI